tara:strand:- start:94 stop:234 length:141 start_codon:yes stop_codon:yes gene_type:complete
VEDEYDMVDLTSAETESQPAKRIKVEREVEIVDLLETQELKSESKG